MKTLRSFGNALVFLMIVLADVYAQTPSAEPGVQEKPVVDASTKEQEAADTNSLVDGLFNVRNRIGIGLTLSEFYTPDTLVGNSRRQAGSFTSASSSLYANFQRSRSQFHLDYTFGYRRDNKRTELDGVTQSAGVSWGRTVGRRGSLSVTNAFVASTNDYGITAPVSIAQGLESYVFTQEIIVNRQKVIRNSLAIGTGYQIGKRASVRVFASHDLTRYQRLNFYQSQMVQVGFNAQYQVTKWLFFDTSYTRFMSTASRAYRGTSIQRLRPIGLRFHPWRIVDVSLSGGVEYARNPGSGSILSVADVHTGLSVGSRSTAFSIAYHHGLTSLIGVGAFESHNGIASLMHKVSDGFSMSLNSTYTRGGHNSTFESVSASGVGQLKLVKNLIFSVNQNFSYQHIRNLNVNAPRVHRFATTASIHYILPPLRVR